MSPIDKCAFEKSTEIVSNIAQLDQLKDSL